MRLERGTFVARETIQGIWIIHHIAETRGRHNELFSLSRSSEYRDSRKEVGGATAMHKGVCQAGCK